MNQSKQKLENISESFDHRLVKVKQRPKDLKRELIDEDYEYLSPKLSRLDAPRFFLSDDVFEVHQEFFEINLICLFTDIKDIEETDSHTRGLEYQTRIKLKGYAFTMPENTVVEVDYYAPGQTIEEKEHDIDRLRRHIISRSPLLVKAFHYAIFVDKRHGLTIDLMTDDMAVLEQKTYKTHFE